MPTVPLTDEQCRIAVDLVEEGLRKGYGRECDRQPRAKTWAAKEAVRRKITKSQRALYHWLDIGEERGIVVDEAVWVSPRYTQPVPKVRVHDAPPPNVELLQPQGSIERVLVIGDLHQDPRHPHRTDVLKWIARYGAKHKIPRVVQIGDWSTWDSVSAHDRNDTKKGRLKPTVEDDFANLKASLEAWQSGKGDWKPKQYFQTGNHEYRVFRFENMNPELGSGLSIRLEEMFLNFGWRVAPFGEITYIENVGFVHHPINGAGKAYGGRTGSQRAGKDSSCSLVSGHTHFLHYQTTPKIGPTDGIDIMEVGCALPHNEVEHYALHSLNSWWYGVIDMKVQAGRIRSFQAVSMLDLEAEFGDKAQAA